MNRPNTALAGLAAVVMGMGPPAVCFVALNALRPDLVAAMLDGELGSHWVGLAEFLSLAATAGYLLAMLGAFKTREPRVILMTVAGLVFTLPSVAVVLFGPIAFSVMNSGTS